MAKKMKKLMSMALVLCMMASMLSVGAFAADGTVVETEAVEGGTVVTTTTTTTDENGNVTVNVKIEEKTSGTDSDGREVTRNEVYEETVVTDSEGNELASNWELNGKETSKWTEDDNGDGAQPEVDVSLIPGETTTDTAGVTSETVTNADGSVTTTTTTDRTVTAETSKTEVTITESELVEDKDMVMTGPAPVYDPEDGAAKDAAGKEGVFDRNFLSSHTYDYINVNGVSIWVDKSSKKVVDIVAPEGAELPEHNMLNGLAVGSDVASWYPKSNTFASKLFPEGTKYSGGVKMNDISKWYDENGNLAVTVPEDGDFMYVGTGEHSLYYAAYVTVTYEKDPVTGETVYDEEGNPVIKSITKSDGTPITINGELAKELPDDVSLKPIFDDYNGSRAQNFMLMDKNGNRVYAYCCDIDTGAVKGKWYSVSNLEDSDYYASEESEEHLRSILMNGYWGTSDVVKEDGSYEMGSLEGIKAKLKAAINDGTMENEVIEMTVTDAEGNETVISKTMLELIDELTEGEALLATQAAVWSYSNDSFAVKSGKDGTTIIDPDGYKWNQNPNTGSKIKDGVDLGTLNDFGSARVDFLYSWLITLESEEESTVVINDKNFVEDMSLTVGDKAEGFDVNADDNKDNDVYNVDLNFKLAFIPGEKDDLLVQISYTDLDGNVQNVVRRLAGKNAEGQSYLDIKPEADGSYVLKGLKLSENKEFDFDLRLEGTQYLENGVYVYAPVGGRDVSQTFVGVAEGTRNVDASVGVTVKFDVDENNHVVAERTWHDEADPQINPGVFAFAVHRPLENIPEEEVPLADAPQTGDEAIVFAALTLLAGISLMAMHVSEQKRKEEV